jgi:hypothetical protein
MLQLCIIMKEGVGILSVYCHRDHAFITFNSIYFLFYSELPNRLQKH